MLKAQRQVVRMQEDLPSSVAVSILGDSWTILIVREAFRGARRYSQWREQLAISELVLADRLKRLVSYGVFTHHPAEAGLPAEYRLTDAGLDLWRILLAMWKWQREILPASQQGSRRVCHVTCGHDTLPDFVCRACGQKVLPQETRLDPSSRPANPAAFEAPRYRRSVVASRQRDPELKRPLMFIIGDQWSAHLLSAFFRGAHGFDAIQADLGLPPAMLSQRLATFVRLGILRCEPHRENARRKFYRLTAKGLALYPIVINIVEWGARWLSDGESGLRIVHLTCGKPLVSEFRCDGCHGTLERRDVQFTA